MNETRTPPTETPGLHWTIALQCPECKTLLRYVDTAPSWRESEVVTAALAAAREYAEAHAGETIPQIFFGASPAEKAPVVGVAMHRPYLIVDYPNGPFGPSRITGAVKSVDARYVDCPACGAEVFVKDAVELAGPQEEGAR